MLVTFSLMFLSMEAKVYKTTLKHVCGKTHSHQYHQSFVEWKTRKSSDGTWKFKNSTGFELHIRKCTDLEFFSLVVYWENCENFREKLIRKNFEMKLWNEKSFSWTLSVMFCVNVKNCYQDWLLLRNFDVCFCVLDSEKDWE